MTVGDPAAARRWWPPDTSPGYVPTDSHLDELLRYEESGAELVDVPETRPWRLRAAGFVLATSAVAYTLSRAGGLALPIGLILAVVAAAVLVRRALKLIHEPLWLRAADLVRPPGGHRRIELSGWYEGDDGMAAAVRRWDRRLDWGSTDPDRFNHTVPPRIGELVDERLRQRHSLTRASDPARARALLGEEIWAFLHEPATHVPTPREIAVLVTRMEKL
ncbi:MAG: hypothetical protein ACM30G_17775 [Micromonosporaceae bacterium]